MGAPLNIKRMRVCLLALGVSLLAAGLVLTLWGCSKPFPYGFVSIIKGWQLKISSTFSKFFR
jgi:hypothetical protein